MVWVKRVQIDRVSPGKVQRLDTGVVVNEELKDKIQGFGRSNFYDSFVIGAYVVLKGRRYCGQCVGVRYPFGWVIKRRGAHCRERKA